MDAVVTDELDILRERVVRILNKTFGGIHHVPSWENREEAEGPNAYINFTYFSGLATYDFDYLTRLVIGAHEECVRLNINPVAYRYSRLSFSLRQREGSMMERHPTIEQAIEQYRRS